MKKTDLNRNERDSKMLRPYIFTIVLCSLSGLCAYVDSKGEVFRGPVHALFGTPLNGDRFSAVKEMVDQDNVEAFKNSFDPTVLLDHPELLLELIKSNRIAFLEAMNDVSQRDCRSLINFKRTFDKAVVTDTKGDYQDPLVQAIASKSNDVVRFLLIHGYHDFVTTELRGEIPYKKVVDSGNRILLDEFMRLAYEQNPALVDVSAQVPRAFLQARCDHRESSRCQEKIAFFKAYMNHVIPHQSDEEIAALAYTLAANPSEVIALESLIDLCEQKGKLLNKSNKIALLEQAVSHNNREAVRTIIARTNTSEEEIASIINQLQERLTLLQNGSVEDSIRLREMLRIFVKKDLTRNEPAEQETAVIVIQYPNNDETSCSAEHPTANSITPNIGHPEDNVLSVSDVQLGGITSASVEQNLLDTDDTVPAADKAHDQIDIRDPKTVNPIEINLYPIEDAMINSESSVADDQATNSIGADFAPSEENFQSAPVESSGIQNDHINDRNEDNNLAGQKELMDDSDKQ
jgi:hypothetical protein